MDHALHLRHALLDCFNDLLIFGHDGTTGAAGHFEEAAHIDVAGTQRGGSPDHGFAHSRRQSVEQDEQGGHAGNGRGQKEGAAAVLEQAAKSDAEIEEKAHD